MRPPNERGGPPLQGPPREVPPTSDTDNIVTDVGDLLVTWVGIQMDTVDALVADGTAKVAAIPDLRVLWELFGELLIRITVLEREIAALKGGRR